MPKRINPDWDKIQAEYIKGNTSFRKLAEKYGVSFSSIRRRAEKFKWTDLRTQTEQKACKKIVERVASQKAERVDTIEGVADMLIRKISEAVADGSFTVDTQSVRQITAALKDLRDIKGLKSDADVREQEARIEKLRKEAQIEEESKDIKVVIAPDLEDYSG